MFPILAQYSRWITGPNQIFGGRWISDNHHNITRVPNKPIPIDAHALGRIESRKTVVTFPRIIQEVKDGTSIRYIIRWLIEVTSQVRKLLWIDVAYIWCKGWVRKILLCDNSNGVLMSFTRSEENGIETKTVLVVTVK